MTGVMRDKAIQSIAALLEKRIGVPPPPQSRYLW